MGGDGTPRSYLPAALFGVFVRMILVADCICVALILWALFTHVVRVKPTAADLFGCAKTHINARGEDTGECE